jgi:hypothetical protein
MRKRWVRNALIGCFGLVVAGGALLTLAWPYLWWRQWDTLVSVDGRPVAWVTVYRTYDGRLLLADVTGGTLIIQPSSGSVGFVAQAHVFRVSTSFFVLAEDKPPHTIDIADPIKGEDGDARLVFRRGEYVEFSTDQHDPTPPAPSPKLVWRRVRVPLEPDNKG